MRIQNYQESEHIEIANLFHDAVHAIEKSVYSIEQCNAWAPSPPDYLLWKARLALKAPFVAYKESMIVGFIELEADGHIDCLYVHKDYQGQGIAAALFKHLLLAAKRQKITSLHVEASKVAVPFFKKYGFTVQQENTLKIRGEVLVNYSMSVDL
jgi:putative acetyltransferase